MEEVVATRYWCHACSQMVNPIMEIEIKCPFCRGGFVEEMSNDTRDVQDTLSDLGSPWAPILLGMIGNTRRRRRRLRRLDSEEDGDDNGREDGEESRENGSELDQELELIMRRRRRSSAAILQMLQSIRGGMASELEDSEGERNREHVILINPFNQTIIVQGSNQAHGQNPSSVGSLGDYFIGPGLDLLLQHLAENDPNGYGTPPAKKDAVEAMPSVKVEEYLQCSVCLDDFEIGAEAKEMPCKHKFHSGCILPWLGLHSSCPVCRHQMPADESKVDGDGLQGGRRDDENFRSGGDEGNEDARSGNGRRFSIPWPFNGLFSSASHTGGANSSSAASSSNGEDVPHSSDS